MFSVCLVCLVCLVCVLSVLSVCLLCVYVRVCVCVRVWSLRMMQSVLIILYIIMIL